MDRLTAVTGNAGPHNTVSSIQDLSTGHWFDPWLGQYSFQGTTTIVITTGFIPLSRLPIVLTMVMWERSQWLGKNIVQSTGLKNSRRATISGLVTSI